MNPFVRMHLFVTALPYTARAVSRGLDPLYPPPPPDDPLPPLLRSKSTNRVHCSI